MTTQAIGIQPDVGGGQLYSIQATQH